MRFIEIMWFLESLNAVDVFNIITDQVFSYHTEIIKYRIKVVGK